MVVRLYFPQVVGSFGVSGVSVLDVMLDHPNFIWPPVDIFVASDGVMSSELKGLCRNLGHMMMFKEN